MNRKLFSTSAVQDENRIWTSWLMPWSLASCRNLSRSNNLWCAWNDLKIRLLLCCLFSLAFYSRSNSKNRNLHFANVSISMLHKSLLYFSVALKNGWFFIETLSWCLAPLMVLVWNYSLFCKKLISHRFNIKSDLSNLVWILTVASVPWIY